MNIIPQEAIDAAEKAGHEAYIEGGDPEAVSLASVKAAFPVLAAHVLRDHANAVITHRVNATPTFLEGMKFAALQAMNRADEYREGK